MLKLFSLTLILPMLLTAGLWSQSPSRPISFDRIMRADQEPQNWLTYSGSIDGRRHSLLTQITPANVKNLELAWTWQAQ
jgi:glucose dehydrogenase